MNEEELAKFEIERKKPGWIDPNLKKRLDIIKDQINKRDMDHVMVVCGSEGVGKSTYACHVCNYVDPNFFEKDNVITNLKELKARFRESTKGTAILIDEGAQIFYVRDAMTKDTKEANQLLRGLRGKNCFIVICIPDLWALEKYIIRHRISTLVKVLGRGKAAFYNKKKIEKMVFKHEHPGRYKKIKVSPSFSHYFNDLEPRVKKKYLELKDQVMESYLNENKKTTSSEEKRVTIIQKCLNAGLDNPKTIAYIAGTTVSTVRQIISGNY